MLDEYKLIDRLKAQSLDPKAIGDDAAVLPYTSTESLLISKDCLVENIHFRRQYQTPKSLAHKALQVNLSDIAAMGGQATAVLLGLSIPPCADEDEVYAFLDGFTEACRSHNVRLIGGDTVGSPGSWFISVTVLGKQFTSRIKYRHRAEDGDRIYLAGELGCASLGFQALEQTKEQTLFNPFKTLFLNPKAKLPEGLWLSQQPSVRAMMDVSDGLWLDLSRLCQASGKGAALTLDAFPQSDQFLNACHALDQDPLTVQLSGGEDYGLLLTVDAYHARELEQAFFKHFQYPIYPLGQIEGQSGIQLRTNQNRSVHLDLFSHF